jgi:hypothetical protein
LKSFILLFSALFAKGGFAQISLVDPPKPKAYGAVWLDIFGGPRGAVIYPQYAWKVDTIAGTFTGFGFVEVAPREPFFTNNLLVYTPPKATWLSVHTETGGLPDASPRLGFVQVGPRINAQELVPGLKKPLHYLFAAVLPRFIGIRPNNLLLSGATNKFHVARGLDGSIEGYRRFFPGHRPDYAEYWFLLHPKKTKNVSFAAFVLHDGNRITPAFGFRVQP